MAKYRLEEIRAIISALIDIEEDVEQEVDGWQPMDTAPMDGTAILLAFEPCVGYLVMAKWYEKKKGWGWVCSYTHRRILDDPTHWHHLPSQPYTDEEQDAALEARANGSRVGWW
jgi:hypothetical protein